MQIIDWGNDDERTYLAFFQIGTGPLRLTTRALLGIEFTTETSLEGKGVYLNILFLNIRIS